MSLSSEEVFASSRTTDNDVGFFESALAGVATGLWNIPKGFVSLGAEIFDLIGDTDKAKEVEEWFDEVNPFDDEAQARTAGKVFQALAQIGPVAIGGGALGIRAGKKLADKLAKRAVSAKQGEKYFNLAKYGEKIIGPKTGAIVGGGLGEAFVADEDIGTFADMARGTSFEPFAITMMDKSVDKEGRADAGRKLLNRLKFGTEGIFFNAAIAGVGTGIGKLQKPSGKYVRKVVRNEGEKIGDILSESQIKDGSISSSALKDDFDFVETGVQEYGDGILGKLKKYGINLKPYGTGTTDLFSGKRAGVARTLVDNEVSQGVAKRFKDDLKETFNFIEKDFLSKSSTNKAMTVAKEEKLMERVSNLLEPKKGQQSLLKRESKEKVLKLLDEKQLNEAGLVAFQKNKELGKVKTKQEFINKLTPELDNQFIKKRIFKKSDYYKIEKGKKVFNKELEQLRKEIKDAGGNPDRITNSILRVRRDIDNMNLITLGQTLPEELAEVVRKNIGSYLTTEYKIFNRANPLTKYPVTSEQIKNSKNLFLDQYKREQVITLNASRKKEGLSTYAKIEDLPKQELDRITNDGLARAETEVNSFLRARSIDEVDVGSKEFKSGADTVMQKASAKDIKSMKPGESMDLTFEKKKLSLKEAKEIEGIQLQTDALKQKILDPWQREIAGVIKDPSYTFYASVMKLSNLNNTMKYLKYVDSLGSGEKYLKQIKILQQQKLVKGLSPEQLKAIDDEILLLNGKKKASQFIYTEKELKDQFGKNAINDTNFKKYESPQVYNKQTGENLTLTPLSGKYIRTPIYDAAFDVTTNLLNRSDIGTAYKLGILLPKAASQVAKTILSPVTHMRNFISAGAFAGANGVFFPSYGNISALAPKILGGKGLFGQAFGTSVKGTFGGKVSAPYALLRQRMQRVDVLSSAAGARETEQLLKDVLTNPGVADKKAYQNLDTAVNRGVAGLKTAYDKAQELYMKEDDFWKSLVWGVERGRYDDVLQGLKIDDSNYREMLTAPDRFITGTKNINPKFSEVAKSLGMEEDVLENSSKFFRRIAKRQDIVNESFTGFLDEIGGSLVRNQVPNYNYIGRTGRALRQTPFGNFIAFPLEMMRTGNNIMAQAIEEMTSGISSIQKIGYQRFFGFGSTVLGLPKALTEFYKAKNNVNEAEMSALRKFVPEWSKNSTLLPVGRDENGYLKYVDFSYTNAYDALTRPFRAVANKIGDAGETGSSLAEALGEGMLEGTTELLEPFASESIFTEALVDSTIRRGIGKDGRRVWQEADDSFVKIIKGVSHLGKSLQPGSYQQLKRVARTALNKTDQKYGQTFELDDEVEGLFGFRTVQVQPEKALNYMTTRFSKRYKNANNLFTASLLRGGRVSPNTLLDTYQYSEIRKLAEMKEMYQNIQAARVLGVPEYTIRQRVKRQGISKDVFNELARGVFTPKRPNDFFVNRMNEITRDLNAKETIDKPNPYFEALPTINEFINQNRNINVLTDKLNFNEVQNFSTGGRVGMQNGTMPNQELATNEDLVIKVWISEPEPIKRIFNYDYKKYYESGEWQAKVKEMTSQPMSVPLPPTPEVNTQVVAPPVSPNSYKNLTNLEKDRLFFNNR